MPGYLVHSVARLRPLTTSCALRPCRIRFTNDVGASTATDTSRSLMKSFCWKIPQRVLRSAPVAAATAAAWSANGLPATLIAAQFAADTQRLEPMVYEFQNLPR